MPLWMLANCLGFFGILLSCGWGETGKFVWAVCWMVANMMPTFVLFMAYDNERCKRREVEIRWRKESQLKREI